ncbi:MAG: hypothetical protein QM788_05395 [Roseateles sp.]|uniref:hypothetical protein n=1 Tax=Roseateles sp. TaxID=1971397 RepID=UPI0039EC2D77
MSDLSCPICGTELTMAGLLADSDAQQAFARLAAVSIPLGARVMQYLTLFTPPKTRLTVAKQVKLVLQLLPDLEREAITAKGRDWAVPRQAWAAGLDQVLASRERLDLPLKGHGYLFAILVGLADKHEARQERDAEAQRRARAHVAGAQPLAAVLPGQAASPAVPAAAAPAAPAGPSAAARRIQAEIAAKLGQRPGAPTPQEYSA